MSAGNEQGISDAMALLALQETPGVGRAAAWRILALSGRIGQSLGVLMGTPVDTLLHLGASNDDARHLRAAREHIDAARIALADLGRSGGETAVCGASPYPVTLRTLLGNEAPPLLCLRGATSLLARPCAGIVGGRRPEEEAMDLARACASEFVRLGAVVVSGGARGIDTRAHEGALTAGGRTIVVLPQGLLSYHPTSALEEGLSAGRVLLVSELAPAASWSTPAAVTRNATISALGAMLCLIAPRRQGGSVTTARWSLSAGKPVGYAFADCAGHLLEAATETFPLVHPSRGLDRAALSAAWAKACRPGPGQGDLF